MSGRRSSRLVSKPPKSYQEIGAIADISGEDDPEYEAILNDLDTDEPARKKRKYGGVGQKKGRWKGKLRHLPEMPLDILYEILGHLPPFDLLRLARTTKALRALLMARSALPTWQQARSNVPGMPDCPEDLSEPQYADLAFDPYCDYCEAPNTTTILWACRVRSCHKCLNSERFTSESDIHNKIYSHGSMLFSSLGINTKLKELMPHGVSHQGRYRERVVFMTSEATSFLEQVKLLASDPDKLEEYLEEKKAATTKLRSLETLCEAWINSASSVRQDQIKELKERRKNAIFDKLRQCGWGDELTKQDERSLWTLTDHPDVKKPQELTDRKWGNIKAKVIEIMQGLKDQRVEKEHLAALIDRQRIMAGLLKAYTLEQPVHDVVPGLADVCEMLPFKELILNSPDDVTLDEGHFEQAMVSLPGLINEWRAEKDKLLLALLPSEENLPTATTSSTLSAADVGDLPGDLRQLALATTFFECTSCNKTIPYPGILVHDCLTRLHHVYRDSSFRDADDTRNDLWLAMNCEPWNLKNTEVIFQRQAYDTARRVVECCGLDPTVATAKEMDDLDARLECVKCYHPSKGHSIMTWRRAVSHIRAHPYTDALEWNLLDSAQTQIVKDIEVTEPNFFARHSYSHTICVKCRLRLHGSNIVKIHMAHAHSKDESQISEEDVYSPLDDPVLPIRVYSWLGESPPVQAPLA